MKIMDPWNFMHQPIKSNFIPPAYWPAMPNRVKMLFANAQSICKDRALQDHSPYPKYHATAAKTVELIS